MSCSPGITQLDCTWGEPGIKASYEVKVEESEKAAVTGPGLLTNITTYA